MTTVMITATITADIRTMITAAVTAMTHIAVTTVTAMIMGTAEITVTAATMVTVVTTAGLTRIRPGQTLIRHGRITDSRGLLMIHQIPQHLRTAVLLREKARSQSTQKTSDISSESSRR